jgi:hypothetical protein
MCSDQLSLDELYEQKKTLEDIKGLSSQNKLAKFWFEKM